MKCHHLGNVWSHFSTLKSFSTTSSSGYHRKCLQGAKKKGVAEGWGGGDSFVRLPLIFFYFFLSLSCRNIFKHPSWYINTPLHNHSFCTLPFRGRATTCLLNRLLCVRSVSLNCPFQARWGVEWQLASLLLTPLSCFPTKLTEAFTMLQLKWEWGQGCWQEKERWGLTKAQDPFPQAL